MVTLPNPKGHVVVYGALGLGGALAYTYYRRRKDAAANAAPLDPAAYPDVVDGGSYSGISSGGAVGVTPSAYPDGTPQNYSPSDNKSWAQAVTTYLSGIGYNATAVANALGAYFAGVGLTQTQLNIVRAGLAYQGNTPQAVPPPHAIPSTGQTNKALAAPNIRVSSYPTATTAHLQWSTVPNANSYQLLHNGSVVYSGSGTGKTVAKKSGKYQVRAVDTTKKYTTSPLSYPVTV